MQVKKKLIISYINDWQEIVWFSYLMLFFSGQKKNTSNEICVRVIRFLLNWLINNSFCAKVCEVDQLLLRLRHLKCFRGLFLLLFLFSFVNYIFKLVHFIQQINDFHMIINMHISLLANSLNPKRI